MLRQHKQWRITFRNPICSYLDRRLSPQNSGATAVSLMRETGPKIVSETQLSFLPSYFQFPSPSSGSLNGATAPSPENHFLSQWFPFPSLKPLPYSPLKTSPTSSPNLPSFHALNPPFLQPFFSLLCCSSLPTSRQPQRL